MYELKEDQRLNKLITEIGSINCLLGISSLLGVRDNLAFQPIIEVWINFILEKMKEEKSRKHERIDYNVIDSSLSKLVSILMENTEKNLTEFWSTHEEKEDFITLDEFCLAGRKGIFYNIFPDLYDGSFFQVVEAIQLLEELIKQFSNKQYKEKFIEVLDNVFSLVDEIRKQYLKMNKKCHSPVKKIKKITIPNIEFVKEWLAVISREESKTSWMKTVNQLLINVKDNGNAFLDELLTKDFIGFYVDNDLFFFSPFRIFRSLYNHFITCFFNEITQNTDLETEVTLFIIDFLLKMIYTFERDIPIIFFPQIVDQQDNVIIKGDIGFFADTTKLVLFTILNPIESDYHSYLEKMITPEKPKPIIETSSIGLNEAKVKWEDEGGNRSFTSIRDFKNIEIFNVIVSGLLNVDIDLSRKFTQYPFLFSLWELRNILLHSDLVRFPLYLRLRENPSSYVNKPTVFRNELDFFEFCRAFGFGYINIESEFAILSLNWDLIEWHRRMKPKYKLHPNYLYPTNPALFHSEESRSSCYQLTSGGMKEKYWVIDIMFSRIAITFDPKKDYKHLILITNILTYYFSKFNDQIVEFLKRMIISGREVNEYLFRFRTTLSMNDKLISCKKQYFEEKALLFEINLSIKEILPLWLNEELNLEIELTASVLYAIVNQKWVVDEDLSLYREFLLALTSDVKKFYATQYPYRGRPYKVNFGSIPIPDWSKSRTQSELIRILQKCNPVDTILTGEKLGKYYRKISEEIQKQIDEIIFNFPKKPWIHFLLVQLNDLEEQRRRKRIEIGLSIERKTMEDDIVTLSKSMYELAEKSMAIRHAIESSLSSKNDSKKEFLPNYELYFHVTNLSLFRIRYAFKSNEIITKLVDEVSQFDETGKKKIIEYRETISIDSYRESFSDVDFQRAIKSLQNEVNIEDGIKIDKKKEDLQTNVNDAFKLEFGLTVGDLHNIYEKILCFLDEKGDVLILKRNELSDVIISINHTNREFSQDVVRAFLNNFTLESIKHNEIEPWRVRSRINRLLFKPIIKIDFDYLISMRLIEASQNMIDGILFDGILPITKDIIENKGLEDSVSKLRGYITKEFEKEVREKTKEYLPIVEPSNLKNPGKKWNIPDFPDMEIDIFGIHPRMRLIFVIEVKDILPSYTAHEIEREIRYFTKKPGHIPKNKFRCDMVEKHKVSILSYYNLPVEDDYSILGVFVLSDVKFSSFLLEKNQKMLSVDEYYRWLEEMRMKK